MSNVLVSNMVNKVEDGAEVALLSGHRRMFVSLINVGDDTVILRARWGQKVELLHVAPANSVSAWASECTVLCNGKSKVKYSITDLIGPSGK